MADLYKSPQLYKTLGELAIAWGKPGSFGAKAGAAGVQESEDWASREAQERAEKEARKKKNAGIGGAIGGTMAGLALAPLTAGLSIPMATLATSGGVAAGSMAGQGIAGGGSSYIDPTSAAASGLTSGLTTYSGLNAAAAKAAPAAPAPPAPAPPAPSAPAPTGAPMQATAPPDIFRPSSGVITEPTASLGLTPSSEPPLAAPVSPSPQNYGPPPGPPTVAKGPFDQFKTEDWRKGGDAIFDGYFKEQAAPSPAAPPSVNYPSLGPPAQEAPLTSEQLRAIPNAGTDERTLERQFNGTKLPPGYISREEFNAPTDSGIGSKLASYIASQGGVDALIAPIQDAMEAPLDVAGSLRPYPGLSAEGFSNLVRTNATRDQAGAQRGAALEARRYRQQQLSLAQGDNALAERKFRADEARLAQPKTTAYSTSGGLVPMTTQPSGEYEFGAPVAGTEPPDKWINIPAGGRSVNLATGESIAGPPRTGAQPHGNPQLIYTHDPLSPGHGFLTQYQNGQAISQSQPVTQEQAQAAIAASRGTASAGNGGVKAMSQSTTASATRQTLRQYGWNVPDPMTPWEALLGSGTGVPQEYMQAIQSAKSAEDAYLMAVSQGLQVLTITSMPPDPSEGPYAPLMFGLLLADDSIIPVFNDDGTPAEVPFNKAALAPPVAGGGK